MSNRIDLFHPDKPDLVLAANAAVVFLDGCLCSNLEVIEITRAAYPDFSSARFAYNPNDNQSAQLYPGASICIAQHYNASQPSVTIDTLPLFVGQIESIETNFTDDGEIIEILARDYSSILQRTIIAGCFAADIDNSVKFLIGSELIFNNNNLPNAVAAPADFNGIISKIFAADLSSAQFWTYAEIINYLLAVYVTQRGLIKPSLEFLSALTENKIADELDLADLDLLDALHKCSQYAGLNFRFTPLSTPTESAQAIEFYKPEAVRKVEIELQSAGEQLNISRTNIAAYSSKQNYWPVTHRCIGIGDLKTFEATFELIKAWDPAKESVNFDLFSPSTNPDFYQVRDVFRKWCLNETGRYTAEPYNRGAVYDFSKIFATPNYISKARRFYPALTSDTSGDSLGYYLEVSYDAGQSWTPYPDSFDNLLDECGIWLADDALDTDLLNAILNGTLKLQITCSVISDEPLCCEIADGPLGSAAPVVDFYLREPSRFKYKKVTGKSIFYNSTNPSLGQPAEADDTDALYERLRNWAGSKSEVIETVDLQTPYLALHFLPGDRLVTAPQSRDVINLHSDNRSTANIERVKMDFVNQRTELKITRRRIRQL
ncbi:MAG: hypothetical protein WC374_02450 [Phycisphaerae bacterium]|jgi:hypothetical protein